MASTFCTDAGFTNSFSENPQIVDSKNVCKVGARLIVSCLNGYKIHQNGETFEVSNFRCSEGGQWNSSDLGILQQNLCKPGGRMRHLGRLVGRTANRTAGWIRHQGARMRHLGRLVGRTANRTAGWIRHQDNCIVPEIDLDGVALMHQSAVVEPGKHINHGENLNFRCLGNSQYWPVDGNPLQITWTCASGIWIGRNLPQPPKCVEDNCIVPEIDLDGVALMHQSAVVEPGKHITHGEDLNFRCLGNSQYWPVDGNLLQITWTCASGGWIGRNLPQPPKCVEVSCTLPLTKQVSTANMFVARVEEGTLAQIHPPQNTMPVGSRVLAICPEGTLALTVDGKSLGIFHLWCEYMGKWKGDQLPHQLSCTPVQTDNRVIMNRDQQTLFQNNNLRSADPGICAVPYLPQTEISGKGCRLPEYSTYNDYEDEHIDDKCICRNGSIIEISCVKYSVMAGDPDLMVIELECSGGLWQLNSEEDVDWQHGCE